MVGDQPEEEEKEEEEESGSDDEGGAVGGAIRTRPSPGDLPPSDEESSDEDSDSQVQLHISVFQTSYHAYTLPHPPFPSLLLSSYPFSFAPPPHLQLQQDKTKGVEGLIDIENPNRVVKKTKKAGDIDINARVELSRKERLVT